MCNLYTTRPNHRKAVIESFGVTDADTEVLDNLANPDPRHWPMKPGVVVRTRKDGGPGREAVLANWGLVPHWAPDLKFGRGKNNARSETVATKPTFRAAFKAKRCLITASGYCEWKAKVYYEFTLPDEPVFAMAGLWEMWHGGDAPVTSYTMLTTEANSLAASYHDKGRMPVILDRDDWDTWLSAPPEKAALLLRTYPESRMAVAPLAVEAAA